MKTTNYRIEIEEHWVSYYMDWELIDMKHYDTHEERTDAVLGYLKKLNENE